MLCTKPRPACNGAGRGELHVETAFPNPLSTTARARQLIGAALFHPEEAEGFNRLSNVLHPEKRDVIVEYAGQPMVEFAEGEGAATAEFSGLGEEIWDEASGGKSWQRGLLGEQMEKPQWRPQAKRSIRWVDVVVGFLGDSAPSFRNLWDFPGE